MSGGFWETDWWAQSCFLCSFSIIVLYDTFPSLSLLYSHLLWVNTFRLQGEYWCDWIYMSVPVIMGGPNLTTVIYMSFWASDSLKTRSTSFIYCEKKRRDLQWMFNQLSWVEITYKQSERFKGIHILYPDCTFTLTREVVKAWLSQHLQQGSEAANIRW